MTANVQGSASSIGNAPAATGQPSGAPGQINRLLPSLGGGGAGQVTGGGDVADPAAAGQAAGQEAAAGPNPNVFLAQGRWLGPLATLGGGAMAIKGFQASTAARVAAEAGQAVGKGGGWMKWAGIATALGGLALTGLGFKAKGEADKETEAVAAINQFTQQTQQQMQQFSTTANQQITALTQQNQQLQAQLQQVAQGAGQGTGQGSADGSGGLGVGPGLDTTIVPGSQGNGQTPVGDGQGTPGTPTTPGTGGTQGTGGTTNTGPWSVQSVVGRTVELAQGSSQLGTPIAEAGTFRIEQVAGDANGYATLDEANAAARGSMSTELMGSKFLRWMVVEHEGRFYGVIGKQLGEGQQPNPISADIGNVVAWSAMNHVSENGVNGFKAYSWSQAGGPSSIDVPYGTTNVFGSVTGGGGIGATPQQPTGNAPVTGGGGSVVDQAIAQVTGGGPVQPAAAPFDPATQMGRSFQINASTTAEGDLVRGGVLQVQGFVQASAGGFGTAEEAAVVARQVRDATVGDQLGRVLTMQGSDGRFYVYTGSIVSRATAEVEAAPVHVFGAGVAEFFDGATNAWKAVRDQQAAAA